jgi:ABC-type dipeptide/oligopeptide/nickel transport system permease component
MTRFIIIRITQSIIALIGILILVFFLLRASGDPVNMIRSPTMSEEQVQAIYHDLGLDKPVVEQLWIYVRDLAHGDFGKSLVEKRPVSELIAVALPNTLKLGVTSFVIGMGLAFVLGILAATKRDSWGDNGVKFLAILGQALPGFWVGIMLLLVFYAELHWLPVGGGVRPADYVMPVATMVFFIMPGMMRLVRSTMLDVLDSEYIKLARIKGLPERVVIWKHALRNALISPLTILGMLFAGIVSGAVVTEQIFNWPGMGRLALQATLGRDFPIVQAIVLIVAVMVLGINLLVDITYAYVDPQIRYQKT